VSGHLQLHGLRRAFPGGAAPVLDGLDLEVPAGGYVALLGPSGTGKSTVLRLVAGLDVPDAGRVRLDGRDLAGVPPERRRTAVVFQRSRLFPHLDVRDNVAFAPVVAGAGRRAARADAMRFLALVGADDLARRRAGSLSGGQAQRVALARARAARPEVLLLDEPFSALDPAVRAQMQRLLAELRAAVEPTVLLVTHDRHEAAVVADTVAVLQSGRIAQHATAEELHARPASLAVSRFLGGLNEVPGRCAGGVHRSALGSLDVGPAARAVADGPATLVVRQEAVRLVAAGDPVADVVGTVARVAPQGARSLVEVATAAGPLHAEVAPGAGWAPRSPVGVVLPLEQRWVVPAPEPQDDAALAPA
jgi:putative spermidine/putrescine transport system ATP-binding protein